MNCREINYEAMNEVRAEMCDKCKEKYWEKCGGISTDILNEIDACNNAKNLYLEKAEVTGEY